MNETYVDFKRNVYETECIFCIYFFVNEFTKKNRIRGLPAIVVIAIDSAVSTRLRCTFYSWTFQFVLVIVIFLFWVIRKLLINDVNSTTEQKHAFSSCPIGNLLFFFKVKHFYLKACSSAKVQRSFWIHETKDWINPSEKFFNFLFSRNFTHFLAIVKISW